MKITQSDIQSVIFLLNIQEKLEKQTNDNVRKKIEKKLDKLEKDDLIDIANKLAEILKDDYKEIYSKSKNRIADRGNFDILNYLNEIDFIEIILFILASKLKKIKIKDFEISFYDEKNNK